MTISSENKNETLEKLAFTMSDWLHCNTCFSQPGDGNSFYLTDCGHIYCDRCQDKGWKQKCMLCSTPNPFTRKLTSKLDPPIDKLFVEPVRLMRRISSEMKQLIETVEFQDRQRKRYMDHLHNRIRNQKTIMAQRENELKAQVQSQFDALKRNNVKMKEENEKLKEEIAYFMRLYTEKSHGGNLRSPVSMPNSSPVFVSSSSHKQQYENNRSNSASSLMRKMSPSFGLAHTTITASRISVRTPPSAGRMGVIPPCTPIERSVHHQQPKSVPHPIGLNSDMECSPRY